MQFQGLRRAVAGLLVYLWVGVPSSVAHAQDSPFDDLRTAAELRAGDYTAEAVSELEQAAGEFEQWFAERAWSIGTEAPAATLTTIEQLIEVKQHVDQQLDRTLDQRLALARLDPKKRPAAIRHYLEAMGVLIDLSGRLRYTLRDGLDHATYALDADLEKYSELIELLRGKRVDVGATALAYVLFDPDPTTGASPYPDDIKLAALELIAATGNLELVPALADFVREQPDRSPLVTLRAAEVLWQLGIPQDARPGDSADTQPAMTASALREILERPALIELSGAEAARREALVAKVAGREREGVVEPYLQLGAMRLLPGDWLLMRNPSPYNHFTDLGRGLFTHVGVVAEETGEDGIRRLVIVDLPERGATIPATNVEQYLSRTLHYAFLRHRDPEIRAQMAAAAHSLIGNECQFDLLFDTERVESLRGKPLDDQRIHTYCAGLLLICAQATGRPRENFFPIEEGPPGERCLANLAMLGMSIGDSFVSPTGPLFSPDMELVGWREPMYDPGREVKEAVYDHFAAQMIEGQLEPSPNTLQRLRETVAGLSRQHLWLRRALARANNVSEHMDLQAASRAAAVIETLDEIADRALRGFEQSRIAIMAPSEAALLASVADVEQQKELISLRHQHAELVQSWQEGALTPRDLRLALVAYYERAGCRELDERFFPQALDAEAVNQPNEANP